LKFIKDIFSSIFLMAFSVATIVAMFMGYYYLKQIGYSNTVSLIFALAILIVAALIYIFLPRGSRD